MRLLPDYYCKCVEDISVGFLRSRGIEALLLDIDNTLTFDCDPELSESVALWLEALREGGIKALIISNNKKERAASFAEKCRLPFIAAALKPRKHAFERARSILGCESTNTAVVGDQLFTDMAFARNAGCTAIFVEPMSEDIQGFVRFKRILERPLMQAVRSREAIQKKH